MADWDFPKVSRLTCADAAFYFVFVLGTVHVRAT